LLYIILKCRYLACGRLQTPTRSANKEVVVSNLLNITYLKIHKWLKIRKKPSKHSCDVLIIGGGSAGLRAAIEAHDFGPEFSLLVKVEKEILGLGVLLPTNLRIYFEMKKSVPEMSRIQILMKRYVRVVAVQTMLQFVIIFIMAEFATGFFLNL
jgi:heterodisulfide reductase subunit A-like polyferredoxin